MYQNVRFSGEFLGFMIPEFLSFYLVSVVMLIGALGVVFAPRMYIALLSLFVLILASSFMYFDLNARYIAIFQFILCGICLIIYLFLLLRKIERLHLELKLVSKMKMAFRSLFVVLFGCFVVFFVKEELSISLFDVFNFVYEKTSDEIDFGGDLLPLYLFSILVMVVSMVVHSYLRSSKIDEISIVSGRENDEKLEDLQ